jgi:glycosyltransferase involved in cell wall biosynthesis
VTSVSILIPALNEESTIAEIIESHIEVLNKCISLKYIFDYEIIVLNDGSSDNTLKYIEKYQSNEKLITLSNIKPSGLQNAFKTLYDASSLAWTYLTPGDGQIPAVNLERFITEAHLSNWTHAIFGNRKKTYYYGPLRILVSFLFAKYSAFILLRNIPDVGTVKLVPSILNRQNYKCKSVLQEIERVQYLNLLKYPIKIIDVTWIARKNGKSKGASLATMISVLREISLLKRSIK